MSCVVERRIYLFAGSTRNKLGFDTGLQHICCAMAQADQQQQKDAAPHVHFRWMGSNVLVASLKTDDLLFYSEYPCKQMFHLQAWLAQKLGTTNWFQVTLYVGEKRVTHDVLLGAHLYHAHSSRSHLHPSFCERCHRYSLMPQIEAACQSFVMHLNKATTDVVVHVTRCSEADCNAALSLVRDSCVDFSEYALGQDAVNTDVWNKYSNNVAYMINTVTRFHSAFSYASLKMRQNELVASAALKRSFFNAQFVRPALWSKPSFVLKATALTRGNFSSYLGPVVRGDTATMLSLIKTRPEYFDAATAKTDFEFQCLAVCSNPDVLHKLDEPTQTKVAERICKLPTEQKAGCND